MKRLLLAFALLVAGVAAGDTPGGSVVCSAFGTDCPNATTCSTSEPSDALRVCSATAVAAAAPASPTLTDAVHWWKLNEASGNRADSVASLTLTNHNSAGSAAGSPFGDSYTSFTAASNHWLDAAWDTSFRLGAQDWTWVAWIKPNDLRDEGIVSNYIGNDTASTLLMYTIGGAGTTYVRGTTVSGASPLSVTSPTGSMTVGAWNMVVFGWTESTKKSWIQLNNGIVTRYATTQGTPNAGTGVNGLEIGRRSTSTLYDFDGGISRVGFYPRKLSATEVSQLYNGGSGCDYPFSAACGTADPLDIHYIGDSKTATTTEEIQVDLKGLLTAASRDSVWSTNAISGWTMANVQANIDTYLISPGATPDYVLINIGANDVAALPAEATWKANALYVLDALHTKWPSAQVYFMRVWRRGTEAACDTLATWMADVVTSRSTFAHLGPDERVFLENGDDGVTYTTDGIHPTSAGNALEAAQWKTSLGL